LAGEIYKVLIVDDEPHAREVIRQRLEEYSELSVVGECSDGTQAIESIRESRPDLLFLDINMPGTDGFGVLASVEMEHMPEVIFVTAYDQHAIRAFEHHALDYLLKPFNKERFDSSITRAKQLLAVKHSASQNNLLEFLQSWKPNGAGPTTILEEEKTDFIHTVFVKNRGRITPIRVEDITWFESADHYIYAHAGGKSHLLSGPLAALEEKLDPDMFYRIHRGRIINLRSIKEVKSGKFGTSTAILKSGETIKVSRSKREDFKHRLLKSDLISGMK